MLYFCIHNHIFVHILYARYSSDLLILLRSSITHGTWVNLLTQIKKFCSIQCRERLGLSVRHKFVFYLRGEIVTLMLQKNCKQKRIFFFANSIFVSRIITTLLCFNFRLHFDTKRPSLSLRIDGNPLYNVYMCLGSFFCI